MNDPHDSTDSLAGEIRRLRPAPLPPELRQSLAMPPPRRAAFPRWVPIALSAAAALVMGLLSIPLLTDTATAGISVWRVDSTMLGTTPLGIVERNGRAWELIEEHWSDEERLLCSTTPVTVSRRSERREIVVQPVTFD